MPLLEIPKQKRAVSLDRPPQTGAVLRLRGREFGIRKRIGGVETLIAEVAIKVAVQGIGSALGDHVDIYTQGAAKFGLGSPSNHLKFVDHIQPKENPTQTGG